MSGPHPTNRAMFRRLLWRLLFANRGRLFVMLVALGAGAAVTAALLNLQVDAQRRLSTEFRAFGANVLISPAVRSSDGERSDATAWDSSLYEKIPKKNGPDRVAEASLLYGISTVAPVDAQRRRAEASPAIPVVVVGYQFYGSDLSEIFPSAVVARPQSRYHAIGSPDCQLGEKVATRLGVPMLQFVELKSNDVSVICFVTEIRRYGGSEDSQVFLGDLRAARSLLPREKTSELIALNVPGDSKSVDRYVSDLQRSLPGVQVRPLRQFTEGEAKIYNRISGSLSSTVGIVLLLTALCVMAAMTNVAMERRMDVGLMKAIGGATERVIHLFLAEAALLGLLGGVLGAAAGIFLSVGLGKAVFGMAARPRLIVYPVAVGLTILVAILSAYPLRRLASLRPASVFRGEA